MSVNEPKRPYLITKPTHKPKRETVKPQASDVPSLFVALGDAVKAWGKKGKH